jgi:hypothetical protein
MEYLIVHLIAVTRRHRIPDDQGHPILLNLTADILPSQPVLVDGKPQGETNQVLELPAGTYSISLPPQAPACHPRRVTVTLDHTSPLAPREVYFERV